MMIDAYVGGRRNANEPPEIRDLNKDDAHKFVAHDWGIPALNSKSISRDYLGRVIRAQVYRVPALELNAFWLAQPMPAQTISAFYSNELAFMKIEALLAAGHQLPTGLNANNLPDQQWIVRVLRFIDRKNISCCFNARCLDEPPINGNEGSNYHIVAHGQMIARARVFHNGNLNYLAQNKDVHDQAQALWETKRKYLSLNAQMIRLGIHQQAMLDQRNLLETRVATLTSALALTVTLLRHEEFRGIANPDANELVRDHKAIYVEA